MQPLLIFFEMVLLQLISSAHTYFGSTLAFSALNYQDRYILL